MNRYDVVVVGAGAAGLSAALVLGRARRATLLLDGGPPRNAPSPAAHNLFTRDGTPPAALRAAALNDLRPYGSVEVRALEATDARAADGGFAVTLSDGATATARRLVLATGVRDLLPPIEGLAERWGTSVLHCPYCHGWEVRDEPIALLGRGDGAFDFAQLLLGWSADLVLCSDGPAELTPEQRHALARRGVSVREEPIERLEGERGPERALERIRFAGGEVLARRAIFVRTRTEQRSPLAARLGCELDEQGSVRVGDDGQTSVRGVFAAGDATTMLQQVVHAAASGARAAAHINRGLLAEDFAAGGDDAPVERSAHAAADRRPLHATSTRGDR